MGLRKLPSPAPQAPAPAPVAPTPAVAVLEPPAPSGGAPQLPALNASQLAAFKAFGGGAAVAPTATQLADGPQHPYVVFFHEKVADARVLAAKFPQIGVGDPVLKLDGDFYEASSFPFTILKDFQYWTTNDATGTPTAWHLSGADGRKEVVETLMLLLTPEPILTLTRLKTTKCPIAKAHRKVIADAQTPNALAKDPILGAMAGTGFPPAFRVMSKFTITPKSGKNYSIGGIVTATTTPEQAAAIMAWFGSTEGQAEVAALTKSFDSRAADVKAKAK